MGLGYGGDVGICVFVGFGYGGSDGWCVRVGLGIGAAVGFTFFDSEVGEQ